MRRSHDDCFHEWKSSFKKRLPFYIYVFINWKTHFSLSPETPACLLLQFLWFNKYIQIEDNLVYLTKFSAKNIIFLSQLFEDGSFETLG